MQRQPPQACWASLVACAPPRTSTPCWASATSPSSRFSTRLPCGCSGAAAAHVVSLLKLLAARRQSRAVCRAGAAPAACCCTSSSTKLTWLLPRAITTSALPGAALLLLAAAAAAHVVKRCLRADLQQQERNCGCHEHVAAPARPSGERCCVLTARTGRRGRTQPARVWQSCCCPHWLSRRMSRVCAQRQGGCGRVAMLQGACLLLITLTRHA